MHLGLEELLAARDGEASPKAKDHLAGCSACAARLAELKTLRQALQDLPPLHPPRDLWPSLSERLPRSRPRLAWKALWAAAAAGVLLGTLWLGLRGFRLPPPEPLLKAPSEAPAQSSGDEIPRFMAESQRLEAVLKRLEAGSPVLKGSTASTIAEIQDRIALVDLQISLLQGSDKDRSLLARLWKERVGLLGSLVEVHLFRHAGAPA